ncbi:hypothetical protein [Cetobacterium sp.]|uniref:hypothetical protein n=1 Tax=Cetobacterium sp. TaxID=2071632 RepID=UPI003EE47731
MTEKYKASDYISYDRIVFIAKDIHGLIKEPIKKDGYVITIENNGEVKIKVNEGKALREDNLNLGASCEDVKNCIIKVLDEYQLEFLRFITIERVIDINLEFRSINNQTIYTTFSNAIGKLKYGNCTSGYINNGNYKKIKLKEIKGHRRDKDIKLYSKFEEKGIYTDDDYLRLELIHKSRILPTMKIDDLSDLKEIKIELLEILNKWDEQLPIKLNRYTQPVKTVIKRIKEKVLNS